MPKTEPYVATETIYLGNTVAHYPGEVVPDENVKHNGWENHVARRSTKAAEAAVESAQNAS